MVLSSIIETWDALLYTAYNYFIKICYVSHLFQYHGILKRNKQLNNFHKGERCFIIMNGPSLNKHDLSLLENEIVFTSNYFYRSDLVDIVKPEYHCWLDSKVMIGTNGQKVKHEIRERIPGVKLLFNIKKLEDRETEDIFYTYNKHLPNKYGIRCKMDSLSSGFSTVAWYAVGWAIYMGFSKIYILGLDFSPGAFEHFDSKLGATSDPSKLESKVDVCGNYWQYTKAQYESYALDRFAKKRGIKIINLNRNSCIRAFEFGDYENLFERKSQ